VKKYIYCDLYYLMVRNGINSVSELQRITGLPRRTLDKCINNDSVQIHHNTTLVLCETLDCEISDLYKIVDESEYQKMMKRKKERERYLRSGCVYFIKDPVTRLIKIGKTSDLNGRLRTLKQKCGGDLELIHSIESEDSCALEKQMHNHFDNKKVIGEWFDLSDDDLVGIKKA